MTESFNISTKTLSLFDFYKNYKNDVFKCIVDEYNISEKYINFEMSQPVKKTKIIKVRKKVELEDRCCAYIWNGKEKLRCGKMKKSNNYCHLHIKNQFFGSIVNENIKS